MRIAVLLATYNGEQFLGEQLLSIIQNIHQLGREYEVDIIVSDDSSHDRTLEIIQNMQQQYSRISILDSSRKGSAVANFAFLIKNIDASLYDVVFFSDQDDVWLSDKVGLFLAEFNCQKDSNQPLLVHSDLSVVDVTLREIAPSMFNYQYLNKKPSFRQLVVQNSVTGCVMAINQPLLRLAQQSQIEKSTMHDWYLALIASAFGEIKFIDRPTIWYRQHGKNEVGAKAFGLGLLSNIGKKYCDARLSIQKTREQAHLFLQDYEENLKSDEKNLLRQYTQGESISLFARIMLIFCGYRKYGVLRNMIYCLIWCFFHKRGKSV